MPSTEKRPGFWSILATGVLLGVGCTALTKSNVQNDPATSDVQATGQQVQATGQRAREDFSTDPGWEGVNNRVVATDGPTVIQDFGWKESQLSGPGANQSEIGGTVTNSKTPAWYGMKVGPYSLRDRLSASGRIAVLKAEGRSGAFLGFFNSSRTGWRPMSSMVFEFGTTRRSSKIKNIEGPGMSVYFRTITGNWRSWGAGSDYFIPADGSNHTWSFEYDPEAKIDATWPVENMKSYFYPANDRLRLAQLYANALKIYPNLSEAQLREQLEAAADKGLIDYDPRRDAEYWNLVENVEKYKGCVTFEMMGQKPVKFYLSPGMIDDPMVMDRFGIINNQTYGRSMEFYISALTINGQTVDLGKDPGWDAKGNHAKYRQQDFHGRHDYGYSKTNHAGKAKGEVGGRFWRTEPTDPVHGYYAVESGPLTLDDPIEFSGNIAFMDGQPDSGMWFGYFNAADKMAETKEAGWPNNSMGIHIDGPSRIGFYFTAFASPRQNLGGSREGPIFLPTGDKRKFTFRYDPKENKGVGRITVTLDKDTVTLDLTPAQRAAGAKFDRFGFANNRSGGKFVELYFDDLTYTVGSPRVKPPKHEQKVVTVPYPDGGRSQ